MCAKGALAHIAQNAKGAQLYYFILSYITLCILSILYHCSFFFVLRSPAGLDWGVVVICCTRTNPFFGCGDSH
jgi:hypothetical protein